MDIAVPAGYWRNKTTGGLESIPWPKNLEDLPPSIGFQFIEWAEANLVHHLTGDPWRYTPQQKRILVLHFAVDEDGDWLYRRTIVRMAKGAGKDPFLATLVLGECMGPTKFDHWDPITGRPIGAPHRKALVGIGANSEAQAKELLDTANALVGPDLRRETGYTPGKTASATSAGSRIKIMTASERSAEGDPLTAGFLNETHHMTESNGGAKVARTMRRNVGKSPGGRARITEATNAHEQGGGSVAEKTYESWQSQVSGKYPKMKRDILYISTEADPSLSFGNEDDDAKIIAQAYAHSPWISQKRILAEVYDEETSLAEAIRFYANGVAATESAWVEPNNWNALARPDIVVEDGTEIAMFLDCSKSGDATALVGVRISDGHVMRLGLWQKPHGTQNKRWLAPRHEVDAAVRQAFDRYAVCWFGVDPSPATDDEDDATPYWGHLVEQWHLDFRDQLPVWASNKSAVTYDFRTSLPGGKERFRLFVEMCERVRTMIDEDGTLTHDGDAALAAHVHNCRVRPNVYGVGIGKETRTSPKKVDLAVAMVGALLGRSLYLASGKTLEERSGTAYFF